MTERPLRLGCGEWGFRELPMEEHFRIAREFVKGVTTGSIKGVRSIKGVTTDCFPSSGACGGQINQ